MTEFTIQRPAVGRVQQIGDFYDARRDCFVTGNLFNRPLPKELVNVLPSPSSSVDFELSTTKKEKIKALNLDGDISLSVLAGLVTVSGSAKNVYESRSNSRTLSCIFKESVQTQVESVNLAQLSELVTGTTLSEEPTHVVVGIKRGCNALVEIKCQLEDSTSKQDFQGAIEGTLPKMLENFGCKEFRVRGDANWNSVVEKHSADIKLKVSTDVFLSTRNLTPMTIEEGLETVRSVSDDIARSGEGIPLTYVLYEIKEICRIFNLPLIGHTSFRPLSERQLQRSKQLICESEEQLMRMAEFATRLYNFSEAVPKDRLHKVTKQLIKWENADLELKQNLSLLIPQVRGNPDKADDLYEFFASFGKTCASKENVDLFFSQNDDLMLFLRFQETLKGLDVTHITTYEDFLEIKRTKSVHVLFYSLEAVSYDNELWEKTTLAFYDLCEKQRGDGHFAALNTTLVANVLTRQKIGDGPRIVIISNAAFISKDLISDLKILEENNLATPQKDCEKHDVSSIDLVTAKLACPYSICAGLKRTKDVWYCSKCYALLEYDLKDHFYCRCGRLPVEKYSWKCTSKYHGKCDIKYTSLYELRKALRKHVSYKQVNILVIGETGVGKTTWINSIPSYLSYSTLEEAEKEPLLYLIPFKFNRGVAHENGIQNTPVSFGSSKNEVDIVGKSVTRSSRKYYFKQDDTVFCIIDTPGVGDCDGIDCDKKNMQNVIDFVCTFDQIHLICFLMPPDQSRLHERFQFCFNELIMQFHRSAVKNIAFCMTKASGSNYQVGDTAGPLQVLLDNIKAKRNIEVPFNQSNLFIFDNLAFLHLAAVEKEISINEEQKRSAINSFIKSRDATFAMMRHAQTLYPHMTEETKKISLARRVIHRLVQPLTLIGVKVRETIEGIEETNAKVERNIGDEEELLKILKKKVVYYRFEMLAEETTLCKVCSKQLILKGNDRNPYIEAHPEAAKQDPYIIWEGQSLMPGEDCPKCGPGFVKEIGSRVFLEKKIEEEQTDEKVLRDIDNGKDTLQKILIWRDHLENLLVELRHEKETIIRSLSSFAVFIQQNSIIPYNDITEIYVRMLMDNEATKNGRTSTQYRLYEETQNKYFEEKDLLEKQLENNSERVNDISLDNIHALLLQLQNLKHYGSDIKSALDMVSSPAYENAIGMETNIFVPKRKLNFIDRLRSYWNSLNWKPAGNNLQIQA